MLVKGATGLCARKIFVPEYSYGISLSGMIYMHDATRNSLRYCATHYNGTDLC